MSTSTTEIPTIIDPVALGYFIVALGYFIVALGYFIVALGSIIVGVAVLQSVESHYCIFEPVIVYVSSSALYDCLDNDEQYSHVWFRFTVFVTWLLYVCELVIVYVSSTITAYAVTVLHQTTATCKINGKFQQFSTADLYQFTTGIRRSDSHLFCKSHYVKGPSYNFDIVCIYASLRKQLYERLLEKTRAKQSNTLCERRFS
jgi:hypothetical protein